MIFTQGFDSISGPARDQTPQASTVGISLHHHSPSSFLFSPSFSFPPVLLILILKLYLINIKIKMFSISKLSLVCALVLVSTVSFNSHLRIVIPSNPIHPLLNHSHQASSNPKYFHSIPILLSTGLCSIFSLYRSIKRIVIFDCLLYT